MSRLLPTLSICSPPNTFNTHLLYPPNALSLLVPNTSYTHLLYTPAPTPPLHQPIYLFLSTPYLSQYLPDPRDPVPNTSCTHLLRSPLISYFPSLSLVLQSCYVSSCLELGNPIADVWMDNLELGDQIADMWTTQVPCLTLPPPDFGKAARDT